MKSWKKILLGVGLAVLAAVLLLRQGTATTQTSGNAENSRETGANPETRFYFVHFTDTHLGDKDHIEKTLKAVELINALPMDIKCAVLTGDITMNKVTDQNTLIDSLAVMQQLKAPLHYVPGNHDILAKEVGKTLAAYEKNFGRLFYTAEYNGVLFIFIYTEPLATGIVIPGYDPLAELENALKMSGGKPVLIFHHTPSVEDFHGNAMHDGWKKEVRERWVKLINAYNVKAVFAGHFHRDEHHWLGKIPLYVGAPLAGYNGRQSTFRVCEYVDGKISYRTQYFE